MRDEIFKSDNKKQFEFDSLVASVFDDMISRSIPFYEQNLDLIVKFLKGVVEEGEQIIDLGCSTGATLFKIQKEIKNAKLLGLDNSKDMIEVAKKKCEAFGVDIEFKLQDVIEDKLPKADIILANYLFQFIRPIQREEVVKKIKNSLSSDGYLIVSEKIIFEDKRVSRVIIDIYHSYKKEQGYSEYEIMKKREALENVLVPYTNRENIQLFKNAGFKNVEILFQWANFVTYIVY
jgi:tRNA (cmo5U34)-methyltransferase